MEVGGVQGLIEDGVEGGIIGEVEYKHVSICCWDSGNLQKKFSPWPTLLEASGCCPRLSGVTEINTDTEE